MKSNLPTEAIEEINNHKTDLKTLWSIYGGFKKGLLKSNYFIFSLVASVTILILCFFLNVLYFKTLSYLLDKILSILPNIIGFNIGAYALIIGFGQKNIIDKLSVKPDETCKYTLFQRMGSTFAFSVLVQSLTITISFLLDLFIQNFGKLNLFEFNDFFLDSINSVILFLISFLSIYSFVLIPKIVLNVFGFSQLYHFYNKQEDKPEINN